MILLRNLLFNKLDESTSDLISMMKTHFEYASKKYFKDNHNKYKTPTFKIKSNLKSVGVYVPSANRFDMNADFANDEIALKATIFHETIHYFQTHIFGFSERKLKSDGYHDAYFKQMASKINSGEGAKLVTVSGTFQSIKSGKSVKPYWAYVVDKNDGNIYWSWSPRKSDKFIEQLHRMKDYYKWKSVKVFETDMIVFKEGPRVRGGKSVQFGVIDSNEKLYNKIKNSIK
jgi:hypothetical protein